MTQVKDRRPDAESRWGQLCWICYGPLEEYTVEGRAYRGCHGWRGKIEAMGARLRFLELRFRGGAPFAAGEPVGPGRGWRRSSSAALALARRVARAEGVPEAARQSGLGQGAIWYHAQKGGWKVKRIGRGNR